jgi:DNA repair protein RadC
MNLLRLPVRFSGRRLSPFGLRVRAGNNHPSGHTSPSEADLQLTKRVDAAAQILQIHFLDHVIVGRGFSFQEAGLL